MYSLRLHKIKADWLTDGVDAHDLEALELCDGLELRPGHLDVDALPQAVGHPQAGGRLPAGRPQRGRVHVVGGEVAGPEPAKTMDDVIPCLICQSPWK